MTVLEQMERLEEGARGLGISLSGREMDLFRTYLEKILDWNKRRNIVSKGDEDRLASYHFVDSLSALSLVPKKEGIRCLDIGSGAGFPGLPIKIVRPDILLTVAESRRWRYLFLRSVVEGLGLQGVTVFQDRVERMRADSPGYDVLFMRGVGPLADAVPMVMPLLLTGGTMIAFKSQNAAAEIEGAAAKLAVLGARVACTTAVVLPLTGIKRVFVQIEKS